MYKKDLCSCIKKKQKQTRSWCRCCFFVSACITHSLVKRLFAITALLGNKDKSSGNVEPQQWRSINVGFNDLIPKKTYCKMKEITSQKKLVKVKIYIYDSEGQETFAFILFYWFWTDLKFNILLGNGGPALFLLFSGKISFFGSID